MKTKCRLWQYYIPDEAGKYKLIAIGRNHELCLTMAKLMLNKK